MSLVKQLRTQHQQLQAASDMTTNGVLLTPETVEDLLRLGISRYQVTFDGAHAEHDALRVRPSGEGTFDQIWENLVALKHQQTSFSVLVRIHVSKANIARLPEFLEACAGVFAHDTRFRFFIRPLSRLGGPNDETLPVLDSGEAEETIARLGRQAKDLGLAAAAAEDPVCYAAKANSWVIRANGDLNKCTVALSDPRNRVGRLHPDGTMTLDRDRLPLWLLGLASGQEAELACPWKALGSGQLAVSASKSAA